MFAEWASIHLQYRHLYSSNPHGYGYALITDLYLSVRKPYRYYLFFYRFTHSTCFRLVTICPSCSALPVIRSAQLPLALNTIRCLMVWFGLVRLARLVWREGVLNLLQKLSGVECTCSTQQNLKAEASVERLNCRGLLVGEAADDEDHHSGHPALVAAAQVGELISLEPALRQILQYQLE